MNCPQCGKELPDTASFCNGCGNSVTGTAVTDRPTSATGFTGASSTGATPPATPRPATAGTQVQLNFQTNRLGKGDWIAGGATLALFIGLFLPWYTVNYFGITGSLSALSGHGWMYLVLLGSIATVGYIVARAMTDKVKLPVPHWQALLIITGADLVVCLGAFADKPSGWSYGFGAFFGLIAAIGAVVGAFLRKNEPENLPA